MSGTGPISEADLSGTVADVLLALSNVGFGDFATRVPCDAATPAPIADLITGLNAMIATLEQEEARQTAYKEDLERRLETIERQREAIRELATPIMEVWPGILCLPVVGVLDTERSAQMAAALLNAIVTKRARRAIIDVTGIDVMDTSTAEHFIRIAGSARLLGTECALTGLGPSIAQTVVHMGVELDNVVTFRSLRDALQYYVAQDA